MGPAERQKQVSSDQYPARARAVWGRVVALSVFYLFVFFFVCGPQICEFWPLLHGVFLPHESEIETRLSTFP